MNIYTETYEALLCAQTVDECSERVRSFLTDGKLPKRDVLRYAMTVEELLLKSADSGREHIPVRLSMGTRFFRRFILLELDGEAYNVYAEQESEQSLLGGGMLKNLGLSPEYDYVYGTNRYQFRVRKRAVNPFITLIIAICAALLVGSLGYGLADSTRDMLTQSVLTPLNDAFLDILGCIAGPMIFLAVAWGIYGIGDAATFKRIGKKLILSFVGTVFLVVVIMGFACLPLFNLTFSGASGGSSELNAVFTMLLGVIPKDIFSPFVNGNTLQIIFLAIVFGIAMLFLEQKTDFVAKVVEQINYIVQFLIETISKLVPYFIFIVLLKLLWGNTIGMLADIGKLLAVFIGATLVMVCGMVLYTSLRNRAKPFVLVKKGLPALIVALTTASSAAAFGINMNTCRKEYGIDKKVSSFGLPLGMVAFKPTTALSFMVVSLFFAEHYGIGISVSWIALMMLMACILAVATPPIPGGAMTAYTVLFLQLGIPAEALAIALACDSIFDCISTGFDQFLMPLGLLNQAGRLGLVDRETLIRQSSEK